MAILEISAEDNATNLTEWQLSNLTVKSRINVAGTIITHVNDVSNVGTLADGECAWWLDVSTSPPTVTFTANVGGTTYTGEVKMHT